MIGVCFSLINNYHPKKQRDIKAHAQASNLQVVSGTHLNHLRNNMLLTVWKCSSFDNISQTGNKERITLGKFLVNFVELVFTIKEEKKAINN